MLDAQNIMHWSQKCVAVECEALGGTLGQMVSLSVSGILHYV